MPCSSPLTLHAGPPIFVWPIRAFVTAFRGTPLLVQIFLIYYGLGQFRPSLQFLGLWGFFREPYWCAILALTLNTAAYGTEIIRGGLQSVPYGQIEAARACGMPPWLVYRRVMLPIALRQALPGYGNEIILMIKGTSLTSIVTLLEVTGIAQQIISQTYRAFEVFICAGAHLPDHKLSSSRVCSGRSNSGYRLISGRRQTSAGPRRYLKGAPT